MSRIVGAYVCPRGVFLAECRPRRGGVEVARTFDSFARIESPQEAAGQLNRLLAQAGIKRARLAIAVRGFGMVHHVLSFPPAADSVLGPIIDREMRRLEPDVAEPVTAWIRLAPESTDELEQPQVLAATLAGDVIHGLIRPIVAAGHSIDHLTALPAAMHRIADEFLSAAQTAALIAHLPDGPYLGFSIAGAVRLIIEPPVRAEDPLPDAAAVAEEAELGVVFVRQQFRGAAVTTAAVVASPESVAELEAALGARLSVPVARLEFQQLGAGSVAALGAVLDARAPRSLALAGETARSADSESPLLQLAVAATVAVAALVGLWAVMSAYEARRSNTELQAARQQVELESSRFVPVQATAEQRRLVRDAVAAIQQVAGDRSALLKGLTSVAAAVTGSIRLDSIQVERTPAGWKAALGGSVHGATSGRAVQALNDFYRDLPGRVAVDSLALKQMFYADTTGGTVVHFQMTFGLLGRRTN